MIISNKEKEDIMKIVDSLKDSDILLKGFIKASENEAKKKKDAFCGNYQVLWVLATLSNISLAGRSFI